MNDQTSTLSDTELDRVTGGTHRDPGMKWEEKTPEPTGPERFANIVAWIKGFFS